MLDKRNNKGYNHQINIAELDAGTQCLASNFRYGNFYIDSFIRGADALDSSFGKTFVWLDDESSHIIGFYNIAAGSVDFFDAGIHYKAGGAVHINEFAIDERYQGRRITKDLDIKMSDLLLAECIERCENLQAHEVGLMFITLTRQ